VASWLVAFGFCQTSSSQQTTVKSFPKSIMQLLLQAEYRLVAKKGEGTFSEVLKAQCIKNGKYVAIKCMKNHFDSLDQVGQNRILSGQQ
jgi:serine/threonine protein kinase